jgi:hypothetical protein
MPVLSNRNVYREIRFQLEKVPVLAPDPQFINNQKICEKIYFSMLSRIVSQTVGLSF